MLRKMLSLAFALAMLTIVPVVAHNVAPTVVEAAISTPALADNLPTSMGGSPEHCIRGGCWRGVNPPRAHGRVVYAPGGAYYPPRGRVVLGNVRGGGGVSHRSGERLIEERIHSHLEITTHSRSWSVVDKTGVGQSVPPTSPTCFPIGGGVIRCPNRL